jgi:hypothetical protein
VDMGWKCSYYSRIIDDVIAPNALFVVLNNYALLHSCTARRYVVG